MSCPFNPNRMSAAFYIALDGNRAARARCAAIRSRAGGCASRILTQRAGQRAPAFDSGRTPAEIDPMICMKKLA
jgi:hypothetical protein